MDKNGLPVIGRFKAWKYVCEICDVKVVDLTKHGAKLMATEHEASQFHRQMGDKWTTARLASSSPSWQTDSPSTEAPSQP